MLQTTCPPEARSSQFISCVTVSRLSQFQQSSDGLPDTYPTNHSDDGTGLTLDVSFPMQVDLALFPTFTMHSSMLCVDIAGGRISNCVAAIPDGMPCYLVPRTLSL